MNVARFPLPSSAATSPEALARLQRTTECLTWCDLSPLGHQSHRWVSIHSLPREGRIVVSVTDRQQTRIRHFRSRAEGVSVAHRRTGLAVADMTDALALAEQMSRQWPRPPRADPAAHPILS